MKRFAVALVYSKVKDNTTTTQILHTWVDASSKQEALGMFIMEIDTKGELINYSLTLKSSIEIPAAQECDASKAQ